ncbi:hypothetical protein GCM10010222_19660 [Streptomyces tanashiensis]|nr:hypothetical protein GCM10010222_19660 [Streptomyces tanashiensis]GGY42897.1 hypothetical protein GCM10010299_56520 [Streptomyces tanashiensis]
MPVPVRSALAVPEVSTIFNKSSYWVSATVAESTAGHAGSGPAVLPDTPYPLVTVVRGVSSTWRVKTSGRA